MTHRSELLSAMLDGELTEAETQWVSEHLSGCGQCKIELEDLSGARAAVRSLPMLDLPEDLGPADERVVPLWPRRTLVAALSVAALAVVAVGAVGMVGMTAGGTFDVGEAEAILAATSSLGVVDDGSEVAAIMTSGSSARYSARQTWACRDENGDSVDSTVDVTRIGAFTVMSDPLAGLTVLARGSVSTGLESGPIETVTVRGAAPGVGDYTIESIVTDEYRGRVTDVVSLSRDGQTRANLWIDSETGVIVHRELLEGDGTVACVLELVEFEPIETPILASMPFDITAEVTHRVYEPVSSSLPGSLAGLDLAAVYLVDGGEVGVYGDGLFSVAIVRIDELGVESLDRIVAWEADGMSWAVVGSLPDDLMAEVLTGLPEPSQPNPFVEGWRRIFG
jgi:anti-sigma factor RsiW